MLKTAIKTSVALFITCLLMACSEPVLPSAQALDAEQEQLALIPNIKAGPFSVMTERSLLFSVPESKSDNERELELSVFFPEQGQNYPVLFFSHGNWSTKDKYDQLITFWVSHGYVVIAPNHRDCCSMASGIFNSLRYGNFALIEHRVKDFTFLINRYAQLETSYPKLKGKGDINNIALVGHSFGAFTAQQFGGAGTYNTDDKQYHFYGDDRVKAIVAISPPGPMFEEITAQSWQNLSTPTFVSTGTWDVDSHFFTECPLKLPYPKINML